MKGGSDMGMTSDLHIHGQPGRKSVDVTALGDGIIAIVASLSLGTDSFRCGIYLTTEQATELREQLDAVLENVPAGKSSE
jgi:hypothetical protein